jgi:TRAP-type C4-dicarboxylate transport system permease small subunit
MILRNLLSIILYTCIIFLGNLLIILSYMYFEQGGQQIIIYNLANERGTGKYRAFVT